MSLWCFEPAASCPAQSRIGKQKVVDLFGQQLHVDFLPTGRRGSIPRLTVRG